MRELVLGSGIDYGKRYMTKKGFTISIYPWKVLLEKYDEVMTFHNEVKRVYKEIKENVVVELSKAIKKKCYGCEVDHPSQTQHECLMMDWNSRVENHFFGAMDKLSYSEITSKMDTFLSEEFLDNIMSHIVCNAKKLLCNSDDE